MDPGQEFVAPQTLQGLALGQPNAREDWQQGPGGTNGEEHVDRFDRRDLAQELLEGTIWPGTCWNTFCFLIWVFEDISSWIIKLDSWFPTWILLEGFQQWNSIEGAMQILKNQSISLLPIHHLSGSRSFFTSHNLLFKIGGNGSPCRAGVPWLPSSAGSWSEQNG